MKNIFNRMSRKALFAIAAVATVFGTYAVVSAWGPERPTYTIDSPAPHVTFNSIIDNPNYGDERTFFDVKDASNTNEGGFTDNITVQDGQELLLRVYVHNNAASNLNDDPDGNGGFVGIAENTKVRIHLPTAVDGALRANAYVSADNATPKEVNDTVDFASNQKFGLEYIPGSAIIYTNAKPSGMTLSDSIVNDGATIGYNQLDGKVPGCFEYASIVTIKVVVKKPALDIQKTVRMAGTKEWKEQVDANKGDTVDYQIRVENTGSAQVDNVVIGDNLPPYMTYVQDSTKLMNSAHPNGTNVPSNNVTTGGIDVGSYAPGGVVYVLFQAKVADAMPEACGLVTLRNVGIAGSKQTKPVEDTAIVKVDSGNECVQPTYSCESFNVIDLKDNRKVRSELKVSTSGNASFKSVTINYGDGSTPKLTDKLTDTYQYAKDGTYKVTTKIVFTVDGQDKVVEDANCVDTVSFTTPETPKELPNTGAGSIAGLFAATTAFGATAHSVVSRRRNR